jgi:hypothetical protein
MALQTGTVRQKHLNICHLRKIKDWRERYKVLQSGTAVWKILNMFGAQKKKFIEGAQWRRWKVSSSVLRGHPES